MLNLVIVVFNSVACFILLSLFFLYYGLELKRNSSLLYNVSIIIFSYIPILMGVSLLPYELSEYFDTTESMTETETPTLLIVQKVLYYITLILSFIINPVLMEFKQITENEQRKLSQAQNQSDREEEVSQIPSFCSRLKKALYNQIIYYSILVLIAIIALIILLSLDFQFNFKHYIEILPSITNIYGLILYSLTIGIGLIRVPISIWKKSDPVHTLRYYLTQIGEGENENLPYLLGKSQKEYEKLDELIIKQQKKQITKKILFRILSILAGICSIAYLGFEISYSCNHSLLNIILTKINNEIANQVVLFVFIGLVTILGAHVLTFLNIGSLFGRKCRKCLSKCFKIVGYKFEPGNTESSTFGFWSTYLQRLVPTIAYHCQMFAGWNNSSLVQIMGKLDEIYVFTLVVKISFPCLLAIIMGLNLLCCESSYERQIVKNGLDKLKEKLSNDPNFEENSILDEYIVNDILIMKRNRIQTHIRRHQSNNKEINSELNPSLSSFHSPTTENISTEDL